ncbi:hypothetical protein [Streptomyces sp. SID10815]|uniref:hypothetical protein n=1 Tax=Streptomyces sp. SID10815 TaxID=2706027 RepID=UPI0013CCDE95|nr:hypothetical protein [Streptomyces sp. SID10815]NEA49689.1 hypothetical protein [Streptomyces sp. SID10815]
MMETKPGAAVDDSRRRSAALTDEQRAKRTALGMRGSSPGRPDLALRRAASIRYFGTVGYRGHPRLECFAGALATERPEVGMLDRLPDVGVSPAVLRVIDPVGCLG